MKRTHIIITSLIVVIFIFVKFVPNIKTLIEINQYEKTESSYSESHDDKLLAKLVFESADKQYYYKLQEYGEIFLRTGTLIQYVIFLKNTCCQILIVL